MPELPEVETMCRGIEPVVGARILSVVIPRCRLRPIMIAPRIARLRQLLTKRSICAVERVGKRAILRLDDGARLVFEPRMTGLLLIEDVPNTTHLRFGLKLCGTTVDHLWFWDRRGLGSVRRLTETQFEEQLGHGALGPDALQVTCDDLRQRLAISERAVKVALMDQHVLAGIGNLYAAEILHVAGIDPRQRCARLTQSDWQRLHSAIRKVLCAAIRYEGSTLNDGTFRNALNRDGSYQNHHRVYMKAGEPCRRCRSGAIQRIVQAQRSTFFCPSCQCR